jgi:hypothetical protein
MSREQIEEMAKVIDEVSEFTILGVNDAFIKVKVVCDTVAKNFTNEAAASRAWGSGNRPKNRWVGMMLIVLNVRLAAKVGC